MTFMRIAAASVIAAGIGALCVQGAAAQLSGPQRDEFIQGSIKSCTKTASTDHPEIPAATIGVYCTCMAAAEADITTQADIDYINSHGSPTDDFRQRVLALAPACNAKAGLR